MHIYSVFFVSTSVLAAVYNIPLTNKGTVYTVNVGIGSPKTVYELLVDTGSGNTWIGANKQYVPTSTSQDTGNSVSVTDGDASFTGEEWTDTVTIGNEVTIENAVISKQSIGVASRSSGFSGVDGILGLGPVDLTAGTVNNVPNVPTVIDNLFSQGTIDSNQFGISFEPTTSIGEINGELTLGGVDSTKFTGSITYALITTTSPASNYWGIDASATYDDKEVLSATAGIIDSGTSLILIATDAFEKYKQMTGGELDSATGLLKITPDQYANLKPLSFNINGETFTLTRNAQIFPRSLNNQIGGDQNGIYLIISDIGTPSGAGLDFILGKFFMERFYTVFDTANQRVGIATTAFTTATSN